LIAPTTRPPVRREFATHWLAGEIISQKGKPVPVRAGLGWVGERMNPWSNVHYKLVWSTERCGRVNGFWVAFSDVVIVVCRLAREGWRRL
jgi:hypothetical protein